MKVLAIDCSARRDGLTGRMTQAACDGAKAAGADVECLHLADLKIDHCRMCGPDGWGQCRHKGTCVIDDDLATVVAKLEGADRLIFSTPVYFGDLSESAKALTDRVRRLSCCPAKQKFLRNLPTLAIAAAGGTGGGMAPCLQSIEKSLSVPGCFLVDLVGVARRNAAYKCETLRLAGQALASEAHESWPDREVAGR